MKNYYLIICVLLVSCATHNIPNTNPNIHTPPNTSVAFVDLNGNFYPENWEREIGPYKRTSSLILTAKKNNVLDVLNTYEEKKLAEYRQSFLHKKRIFIFVHGYNNAASQSKQNYDLLRSKININPLQDEIIEFYWDGLVSKNLIGSGKIWFNATGYSQMAGQFGLRKILNEIHEKDIYIISHSRGASVILSSLSNPPFSESFRKNTTELGIEVNNKISLAENNNRIIAIMIAPAIGEIDFTQENNVDKYRTFSPQLKKVHITINKNDMILKKFIGLQGKYNPTTLGYDSQAYVNLKSTYNFFTVDNFDGQDNHSFSVYIRNPKFQKMIDAYIKSY